jgi:hypothetical protein
MLKYIQLQLVRMHTFRIQYLSNLFLGTSKGLQNPAKQIQPNAPILALLGNIGRAECPETTDFLKWTESKFQRIFWIPGPLEYSSLSQTWRLRADSTYTFLQNAGLKKTVFCQKYQEPLANVNIIATPAWHLGFSNGFEGQLQDWSKYGQKGNLDIKQIFDLQVDELNWILKYSTRKTNPTLLLTHSPISYNLIQHKNIFIHLHGTGYGGNDQSICGGIDPWSGINSATAEQFRPGGFVEFQTGPPKYR